MNPDKDGKSQAQRKSVIELLVVEGSKMRSLSKQVYKGQLKIKVRC